MGRHLAPLCRAPRGAGRGRYLRFEAFLADQGATPGGQSLSDLAIDVTAP